MNNKKQIKSIMTLIIGVTLVWAFALGFTACGDDGGEQRSDRTGVQINLTFGDNNYTATVKGRQLTDTEWSGAAAKVEEKLNAAYIAAPEGSSGKNRFNVFEANDVIINVEHTIEYSRYNVVGNGGIEIVKEAGININALNTLTDDEVIIIVLAMRAGQSVIE